MHITPALLAALMGSAIAAPINDNSDLNKRLTCAEDAPNCDEGTIWDTTPGNSRLHCEPSGYCYPVWPNGQPVYPIQKRKTCTPGTPNCDWDGRLEPPRSHIKCDKHGKNCVAIDVGSPPVKKRQTCTPGTPNCEEWNGQWYPTDRSHVRCDKYGRNCVAIDVASPPVGHIKKRRETQSHIKCDKNGRNCVAIDVGSPPTLKERQALCHPGGPGCPEAQHEKRLTCTPGTPNCEEWSGIPLDNPKLLPKGGQKEKRKKVIYGAWPPSGVVAVEALKKLKEDEKKEVKRDDVVEACVMPFGCNDNKNKLPKELKKELGFAE